MELGKIKNKLDNLYDYINGTYADATSGGYWSNLSKEEQEHLFCFLENETCNEAVRKNFPNLEDIIFDPMRAVGLRLLNIAPTDTGIDYGCMWGNLLIYAAKNCKAVVGIDQTSESLKFLKLRLKEENLDNCFLVNSDLRSGLKLDDLFDFAIVNGVLEWIPDDNEIELKEFFRRKKSHFKKPEIHPRDVQLRFLKMVYGNLKKGGKIYLAIENRFDYQFFLWKKDPHPNLYFTAFLPRSIANIISNIWYGRPYVNYLYSSRELKKLLSEAGFGDIDLYAVFPDYRFPQKIIPFAKKKDNDYSPVYRTKPTRKLFVKIFRYVRKNLDLLIFKKLNLFFLSPSFILIAKK